MALKIYNTASRKKEVFKSLDKNHVKMYVCGVTPYDLSHVGHARSYLAFDVIRRILEHLGYEVKYVQNFTDVDDKIIEKAKDEGIEPLELSNKYINEYFKDMDSLDVKRADSYPRVSEKIPQIIEMVRGLLDKGMAYEVDGDVYMDVSKKKDYGKLSKHVLDDLKAGARVEVNTKKRNPLDFALWKVTKPSDISWRGPWGRGRPGWHLECSVMSMDIFGPTLDIHGGGQDLIFPHHENEIAQSESFSGKPFVNYWLHNGLVTVNGQKMSKSLGNFITIQDALKRYNPQTLRYFLLSTHYRKPLDFSERAIQDSMKGLMRIQRTVFNIKNSFSTASKIDGNELNLKIDKANKRFEYALEDDFNIPKALAAIFDINREINVYLEGNPNRATLEKALETVTDLTGVLGLKFEEDVDPIVRGMIELFIKIREDMRAKEDFKKADRIRQDLLDIGIFLEDHKTDTTWRFKDTFGVS
jgi:cysteinyl-tRNA synthetase